MIQTNWSRGLGGTLVACAVALGLGIASQARATPILTVSDGTNTWTTPSAVNGNGPITLTAPDGSWWVTAAAFTKPYVGGTYEPYIDLFAGGNTAGNFTVTFSDTGFGGGSSLDFLTETGGTICASPPYCTGSTLSVTSATTLGDLSTLGPYGGGAFSGSLVGTQLLPGSFGLSVTDDINSSTAANWSVDSYVEEVPEPGTLALFAAGLVGCGVMLRRRASRAAAAA
jgi:hypothetical protein